MSEVKKETEETPENVIKTPKNSFKLIKKTAFSELASGEVTSIDTSDLCLTDDTAIYQFGYVEEDDAEREKVIIKPGIFTLHKSSMGMRLEKTTLKTDELFKGALNTTVIKEQFYKFFNKLHVYERRGMKTKKRSILYFSDPGNGKSSNIRQTIQELTKEDAGTVVIMWPTSEVDPENVSKFFSFYSEYSKECTRLILIIEEIGGSADEGHYGRSRVTSGLLNFLDGIGVTFTLPTFVVATTNYPQNLLKEIADRPGRFDKLIELLPPKLEERIQLMEFFEKRTLTDSEKEELNIKGAEKLSVAHLQEICIRAELEEMSYSDVIKEMLNHKDKFAKNFETKPSMGLGGIGFGE